MGSCGYLKISCVLGIIVRIALKLWAYSGIVLVICFLLYYFYGGYFAFGLLVFALIGIFYHAQDNFLYYPDLPTHSRVYVPVPTIYGLPYENVNIVTPDGITLHMFFIHQPKDKQHKSPTIVFLHGNAGNIGHRLQNCVGFYHNLSCNILLVEYRGFGLSQGSPSEEGLYIDAKASIDYLYGRNDINHSEIIVFGRSLGGAVAVDLASRVDYADKLWCLIVENTFTSIPDMARVLLSWRFINYIPLFLYKNKACQMRWCLLL
ncbi:protein ABHD13 isoform X2 [Agrilus planipennis]|uniref:Protein ABHD13 n=1 Tax=Agrilus planipennis TaxID=224129 RepID=A0A1W4W8R5_AGRPL|nr:protein ABHD13 isoform X2 [Agrilus planipennis]